MVGFINDDQRAVLQKREPIGSKPRGERLNTGDNDCGHVIRRRHRIRIPAPQPDDPQFSPGFPPIGPDLAEALDALLAQFIRLSDPQHIGAAMVTREHILDGGLDGAASRMLAVIRQTREPAFRVIPAVLPETTTELPFNLLQTLTWVDFHNVKKVSDAPDELERLLRAVQGGPTAGDDVRQAICPWRGLDAFREEDSAFFFGRGGVSEPDSPIGQLVRNVREHSFVMVVGRSGSGKSSLVFAGLVPALRGERDRFWNVLTLRPGPTPLRSLAAAFNPRQEGEGAAEYETKISKEADQLRTGALDLLAHMIRRQLDEAEGKPNRLLVYVDQWEELYAQAASDGVKERVDRPAADIDRFIDLLLTAAGTSPVTVVGTLRADFYDPLIGHGQIRALLPSREVLLARMSRSELKTTIVGPASKVGLSFDPPSLVERILGEAGDDEGMLPLLQYALKESWAHRKGSTITADSYERSGGVREAIRITAERTFEALPEDDQRAARQLFLRLVTPGEGKEDTRARAAMPLEPAQRRIVDQFAGQRTRLLVTGSDGTARPTIEVVHEALIRTWPRLRKWIDANREKLRARAVVLQAKTEWEQNGRREDLLLPAGFPLERAKALLAEPGDLTIDDIQEFIALSSAREQIERKQREAALARDEARVAQIKAGQERTARFQRITRWAFVAVGAVTLIAVATVAYLQSDKEQQLATKAGELAASRLQLATKEEALTEAGRQLVIARASVSAAQERNATLADSLDKQQVDLEHARANLLGELSGFKLLREEFDSALRLASSGTRIDFDLGSPTGPIRASPAAAALAAAVSQANWRFALRHEGAVKSATFSPDGGRVVTRSDDNIARVWDAATGKEIGVLFGHESEVNSAAFSPDGSRIVTASNDKTARIWDVAGKEIAVLRGHEGEVNSAAFSPDGSRIVTASSDQTRIWDAATGKQIAVLRGNSAAFSPDGRRLVTAWDDNTARIWDAATGKELGVLRGHDSWVESAAFSPDGRRIVTTSNDKTARIWDAATGKKVAVLDAASSKPGDAADSLSAAFSPDGRRIVTKNLWDDTARIWDAATGKELGVLHGHRISVNSATFSPDGRRIVTASDDKTARIWDAATGKEIGVLRGHEGDVNSAAFSPRREAHRHGVQ
jgi:WD40 repeat protein/energy-coupling factor transporter ATP-binding protein EcfA2